MEIILKIQNKDQHKHGEKERKSKSSKSKRSCSSKSNSPSPSISMHSNPDQMHHEYHQHHNQNPMPSHTNPNTSRYYHYNVTTNPTIINSKQQKVEQILHRAKIPRNEIKDDEHKYEYEEEQHQSMTTTHSHKANKRSSPKTMPQKEFERYLKQLKLNSYHDKFVETECDSMRYLVILDENVLKEEIGMSSIHCKLLLNQNKKFIQAKTEFVTWLNDNKFSMYQDTLENLGVFTFESFID